MASRLHKRGGYRAGARRPTNESKGLERRRGLNLSLLPSTIAALDAWAAEQGLSRSAAADELLRAALQAAESPEDQEIRQAMTETEQLLNEALALTDPPALPLEQRLMLEAFDNAIRRRGKGKGLQDWEWLESYQGLAKWEHERTARAHYNRIKRELQAAGLVTRQVSKGDAIFRRPAGRR